MKIHAFTLTLGMSSRKLAVEQWRKHGKVFQTSMVRHLQQQQANPRGVVMTQHQHIQVRRVR